MSENPEHQKVRAVKAESQAIGEFIEWLRENDMRICETHAQSGERIEINLSTERLLAKFFEIDLDKLEAEKRAMLEELRAGNARREAERNEVGTR